MTREEAIAVLESDVEYMYSQDSPYNRGAYLMAIEALKAEPRWIPYTERMPAAGENVLLCGTFLGNVAIGKLIRYNTSCCWEVDHWDYDIEDWQAWMPLPEPYKGAVKE